MRWFLFFGFLVILLSRLLFLSISPAFFDSLEYLNLSGKGTLAESLRSAHLPFHPLFLTINWLLGKIPFSDNLWKIEFFIGFCGFLSTIVIYQITRLFFPVKKAFLITLFIAFSPYFWLSQVNILYEPLLILLLLLVFFLLIKNLNTGRTIYLIGSGFFLFLSFLVSAGMLVYLLPMAGYVFYRKRRVKDFLPISFCYLIWLGLGVGVYYNLAILRGISADNFTIIFLAGDSLLGRMKIEGWLFYPRAIRNGTVIYFSYLTIPLAIVLLVIGFQEFWRKKLLFGSWLVAYFLICTVWNGGMYGRLMLFLLLIPFFLISKIKNQWLILILFTYQIVISAGLVIPYHFQKIPYWQEREYLSATVSRKPLIVISNYEEPYLKEGFDNLVLNSPKTNLPEIKKQIDLALTQKKEVLLTSQAVSAPYFLYDGMNYHLISQRKNHPQTEGEKLISHYQTKVIKSWPSFDLRIYSLAPANYND